jgi:hypothetical protein
MNSFASRTSPSWRLGFRNMCQAWIGLPTGSGPSGSTDYASVQPRSGLRGIARGLVELTRMPFGKRSFRAYLR